MRIVFGKKIGSFFIGTSFGGKKSSISGKKSSNGLAMLVLWPFYLVYYLAVWPFVAFFKAISKTLKKNKIISANNKKASIMEAQSIMNVMNSTLKIMAETKNPETFFSRADLFMENLKKLTAHDDVVSFGNDKISNAVSEFKKAIPKEIDSFIERYAKDTRLKIYDLVSDKAKLNKANAFKNVLSEYNDKMTEENIEHYMKVYNELIELASE